jgi:hypothetical protein
MMSAHLLLRVDACFPCVNLRLKWRIYAPSNSVCDFNTAAVSPSKVVVVKDDAQYAEFMKDFKG